jgi:hypothetical protein
MQFGRIPLLSIGLGRGRQAGARTALALLRCLSAVGLGAILAISTVAMAPGQGLQEETQCELEARLDSQDRVRLRVPGKQEIDNGLAHPAVAETSRHCFQQTPTAAPALVHLIGSGIRLLL